MSFAAMQQADVVRVMIVDDSVVARGMAARWIEEQPDLEVVAVCLSGADAVGRLARARPDVVLLDVEMPDMDGIEALPLLLRAQPGLVVLMNSSFTTRGAELSLRCLALGATDVLSKPSSQSVSAKDYGAELVSKIRTLGRVARPMEPARPKPVSLDRRALEQSEPRRETAATGARPVGAIAIGASTGGPKALAELLRSLGPAAERVPIVMTQHMPVGFTETLAQHLSEAAGFKVHEAKDGQPILPGSGYLAPGGRHFSLAQSAGRTLARLTDGPPVNFSKPAVEPLFLSAEKIYGSGLVAIILTGMGSDGAATVPVIANSGGRVIAQDQATSVVWGMPGAAAATGACAAVLPLKEIGPHVVRMMSRGRS